MTEDISLNTVFTESTLSLCTHHSRSLINPHDTFTARTSQELTLEAAVTTSQIDKHNQLNRVTFR